MVRVTIGTLENPSLGRYELEREVTSDFIGCVWMARVRSGADAGSLATIREITRSDTFCERTIEEIAEAAEWAKELDRSRFLAVREVVRDKTDLGIVTRPLEGRPLRSILRKAAQSALPIPDFIAARVILDVVDQWAALSEAGGAAHDCLYGGITPDSVFIERTGAARLLDIAVATIGARRALIGRHVTGASYFAPEQLDGVSDERTDVFAIGLLFWEMLANHRPRSAKNFEDLADRIRHWAVPHLSRLVRPGSSTLTAAVADIVARALDLSPERRFANPAEFAVSLTAALSPATHAEAAHVLGVARPSGLRRLEDPEIREWQPRTSHRDELVTAPYFDSDEIPYDEPIGTFVDKGQSAERGTLPSIDIDVDIDL